MSDPVTFASMLSASVNALDFMSKLKRIANVGVESALFKWDGTRVHGSTEIEVQVQYEEGGASWWYVVRPKADYTFVRFPVVESCLQEVPGAIQGQANTDAQYWRWVPQVLPGRIYGGGPQPNVKVDFIVMGYRPKALVDYFSS